MHIPPFISQRLNIYQGRTLGELHYNLYKSYPKTLTKGWAGRLIEDLLGVTNYNTAAPDLPDIGLEIKTLPLSPLLKVKEHTFISSISLPFLEGTFPRSRLHHKIQAILWVPIIRTQIKMSINDYIGKAFVVQIDRTTFECLEQDWNSLTALLRQEEYSLISSHLGDILHIRPKAQNAAHRVHIAGQSINPMGFYFRKTYTQELINRYVKGKETDPVRFDF